MRSPAVTRPLAALAAALALTAAAPPAQAVRVKPAPLAVVRAVAESGSGQTARASAASSMPKYVATYPKPLIVRVQGPEPKKGSRIVIFSCAEHGCQFVGADQPDFDHVDHVGPVYKVTVVDGKATLGVALAGDSPTASYTVTALPRAHDGERAVSATFTLRMR
jgi:hypothetical protein